jgi:hypothetical protein
LEFDNLPTFYRTKVGGRSSSKRRKSYLITRRQIPEDSKFSRPVAADRSKSKVSTFCKSKGSKNDIKAENKNLSQVKFVVGF